MNVVFDNGLSRLVNGDCRDVLAELPAQSVHMVVTSPPYWGLRSYQAAAPTVWGGESGHEHEFTDRTWYVNGGGSTGQAGGAFTEAGPENAARIKAGRWKCDAVCPCGAWRGVLGSEPTPERYVTNIVEVFRAVKRVLRDDGTLWLNLGPTWAGSGGAGGDYAEGGLREGQPTYKQRVVDPNTKQSTNAAADIAAPHRGRAFGWPAKCMVPIPWMVGLALIQDGWILRSEIIWDKPAPMPESVTDRPTKSHEQILLLVKQGKYFYDAEAIREPQSELTLSHIGQASRKDGPKTASADVGVAANLSNAANGRNWEVPGGRNARSVWRIAPEPSPEKHYAMYPSGLPRRCILAGTSERGCCPECGAQWVRQVERKAMEIRRTDWGEQAGNRTATSGTMLAPAESMTVGWSPACAHGGDPVPSTVLDIFAGTATTLAVAQELGRRSIGIELSPDYAAMAARRLGKVNLSFAGA